MNETVQGLLQTVGLLAFIVVVFTGALLFESRLGRNTAEAAERRRASRLRKRQGPRSSYLTGAGNCHAAAPGEAAPDREFN
ncbi:hypothetical protein [Actinomadura sp. 9N407]|uniref:hypothetical protein n=1 Tax=Actinomadura sp. 9N407 TaxID=3375154 RepID=UPI0037899FC2